jgi:uroporphyrinogen decarboxylase
MDSIFRLARVAEEIMERLGSDCIPVTFRPPSRSGGASRSSNDTIVDIWGIRWKKTFYGNGCFYYEAVHNPLSEAAIDDLENYPWPDTDDPGYTAGLVEETRALYENTEYALIGDAGFKSFWELGYLLRGYDRLLVDLVTNKEFVIALMTKLLDINITMTGRFLDAVGPFIQVFRTADDLATQNGPLMSPKLYRKLLKPFYTEYIELVRKKTRAKIFYHSCGNITDMLEDLIDIGVDIINPVQVSAMIDTVELKKHFGERLVFWGGIDTQSVLPFGTVSDVQDEVKKRLRDLAKGGGYVASAVHNIQPDVPPRNVVAMAEAVHTYGTYPLRH